VSNNSSKVEEKPADDELAVPVNASIIRDLVLKRYRRSVFEKGGREHMDPPLNNNFLVVLYRDPGVARVVSIGFRGPEKKAQKSLDRMRSKRGNIPRIVPIDDYGRLVVIPNPFPFAEDLHKIEV